MLTQLRSGRRFLRRATAVLLGACVAATAVAAPAQAAPVTPSFGPDIDQYAALDQYSTCDPTDKPGVVDFRDLLDRTYGAHTSGISRKCDTNGEAQEHQEGRALDYFLAADDATQQAQGQDLINWLFATDQYGHPHAMARRLGIMYIIWNRQIWGAYRASEGWRPYACSGDRTTCHINHIHFSFSWAGALRQTTWWTAARHGGGVITGDVTGDGRADLIARKPDGTLWLYTNGGSDSAPYGAGTKIGVGWGPFTQLMAGDVTGDGRADVVAGKADGTLWLYRNGGSNSAPYSAGTKIGTGWDGFDRVLSGDVTGDGRADLVARKPDGTLWLYVNGGSDSAPYGAGTKIGVGWGPFTQLAAADVTGDRRADLVAEKADGTLWLYRNGGSNSAPYSTGAKIGTGWDGFDRVLSGDVTGDGRADMVTTKPDGTLWLYRNGGSDSAPYSTGAKIGAGWADFV